MFHCMRFHTGRQSDQLNEVLFPGFSWWNIGRDHQRPSVVICYRVMCGLLDSFQWNPWIIARSLSNHISKMSCIVIVLWYSWCQHVMLIREPLKGNRQHGIAECHFDGCGIFGHEPLNLIRNNHQSWAFEIGICVRPFSWRRSSLHKWLILRGLSWGRRMAGRKRESCCHRLLFREM